MRLLKQLPWVVLFLLLVAGTVLWLLFVGDQKAHLTIGFQNQLERLGDNLFRGHLQGRMGTSVLPEGVSTFAVYDPAGGLVAGWGSEIPPTLPREPGILPGTETISWVGSQVEFVKPLVPMGPGADFWGSPPPAPPPGPPPPRMIQGFLFLRATTAPLANRIWVWDLAGTLGAAGWAGFVVFVGFLWFRARRYRDTLAQNRELLQFAEASRTLGHELQNPLAAILLQTALLTRASGGSPPAEVTVIEEEARRIGALVARVRDFLRDPVGKPERVDLAALVLGLKDRFRGDTTVSVAGPAPILVEFEPERLRSVVENLWKNALEAQAEAPPEIHLSRPKLGMVRLEILDSGPGFTPESLRLAVKPFYTTKTNGTGIGLSITDNFVRAAGGKLKLENRPGGGARVTVDLHETSKEPRR